MARIAKGLQPVWRAAAVRLPHRLRAHLEATRNGWEGRGDGIGLSTRREYL